MQFLPVIVCENCAYIYVCEDKSDCCHGRIICLKTDQKGLILHDFFCSVLHNVQHDRGDRIICDKFSFQLTIGHRWLARWLFASLLWNKLGGIQVCLCATGVGAPACQGVWGGGPGGRLGGDELVGGWEWEVGEDQENTWAHSASGDFVPHTIQSDSLIK